MQANIIDTVEVAIDSWVAEGGSVSQWQKLQPSSREKYSRELINTSIALGYWFQWSDGTLRDWPEA